MNNIIDHFQTLNFAEADPILSVSEAYKKDQSQKKIDLSVAAYRNEKGDPHVFEVVRKALDKVLEDPEYDFEYLPIEGLQGFLEFSQKFVFGSDNLYTKEYKIATVQCPGGTGALRVGFDFLKTFLPGNVYLSTPTWNIFDRIIEKSQLKYIEYSYLKKGTFELDFDSIYSALNDAPNGSIALFQLCAHNPAGVDPSKEQWKKLALLVKKKELFPFFDTALHGWASGDFVKDREPLEIFLKEGLQLMVAQSFSKNMGLYGERVGALHVVCNTHETMEKVLSQLRSIVRPMYSNAPAIGGRIAFQVMKNPDYTRKWEDEFKQIFQRVQEVRKSLFDEMKKMNVKGDWQHLINQTGMFFYSGFTKDQCHALKEKYHIYLMECGRITLSGLNNDNIKDFVQAVKDVLENN